MVMMVVVDDVGKGEGRGTEDFGWSIYTLQAASTLFNAHKRFARPARRSWKLQKSEVLAGCHAVTVSSVRSLSHRPHRDTHQRTRVTVVSNTGILPGPFPTFIRPQRPFRYLISRQIHLSSLAASELELEACIFRRNISVPRCCFSGPY